MQPYTPAVVNPGSGTAVISLIAGVLAWFCLPVVGAILAVTLGFYSRSESCDLQPRDQHQVT